MLKKSKVLILLLVGLTLISLLAACSGRSVKKISTSQSQPSFKVVDDAGKTVKLDKKPTKIVSLSPGNTEILFALGLDKEIVGVTEFDDYPAKAKTKSKIGGFSTPNVEKIISLKPNLVVATGGIQAPVSQRLKKAGITIYTSDAKNLNEVLDDITKLGKLTGHRNQADKLVGKLKARIKKVESKVSGLAKKKVFFEIYGQPLSTAGAGTFVNDLIVKAGGTNVAATQKQQYPQYSLEQLVKDNPDVYLAASGSMAKPADINKRPGYSDLAVVKNGKVYVVDENLFLRPGPRLVAGLELMAAKLYPDKFKAAGE